MVYLKYSISDKYDINSLRNTAQNTLKELANSVFGIKDLPPLKVSKGGKPYIENADFDFSYSHTQNAVAVAVCGNGGAVPGVLCIDVNPRKIGIDIECANRRITDKHIAAVTDKLFTAAEQRYLKSVPGGYKERFLEIWTKKESIVKATGQGLSGIKSADINAFPYLFLKTEYVNIGGKTYIVSLTGI